MTTQTANYLDAIAHLPAGGSLILNDVPWAEYEELLSDLGEGYAVRIAYDRGRLEIMSPTARHEMYKDLLLRLVDCQYVEMPSSLTFPALTDKVLTDALEQSKTEGQSAALRTFRLWLKESGAGE